MGRTPYAHGWLETAEDEAAVAEAMKVTDTEEFRRRDFRSLSGGERQRVILASALAQQPETLLLDEPATFLDLKHQLSLYRLLSALSWSLLVVTVTHDLNLALQFASRVLVLDRGRVAADGAPVDVFTAQNVERVFGVHAQLHSVPGKHSWMTYEA